MLRYIQLNVIQVYQEVSALLNRTCRIGERESVLLSCRGDNVIKGGEGVTQKYTIFARVKQVNHNFMGSRKKHHISHTLGC